MEFRDSHRLVSRLSLFILIGLCWIVVQQMVIVQTLSLYNRTFYLDQEFIITIANDHSLYSNS